MRMFSNGLKYAIHNVFVNYSTSKLYLLIVDKNSLRNGQKNKIEVSLNKYVMKKL